MGIRLNSEKQKELVVQNLSFVHHVAKKLNVNSNDYEDIISIGIEGLIKAAATFDESKGVNFISYADICIKNEINMFYREEQKRIHGIFLEDEVRIDEEGNKLLFIDTIDNLEPDFSVTIAEREILEKYMKIILNLLESKHRLIMLYKIANLKQETISEIVGISQSRISRLERILEDKVKSYFINEQEYKEVYSMAIEGNSYKISFSSKDIKGFNNIFAELLGKLNLAEELPDFKVCCNKERVIIQVPAHPESFSFIAQIIKQIDEYNITFISGDRTESVRKENNPNAIKKKEPKNKNEMVEGSESNSVNGTEIVKDDGNKKNTKSKQNQIRQYILSKETITFKELREEFFDVSTQTVFLAVKDAKKEGLIIPISRGKYLIKKN